MMMPHAALTRANVNEVIFRVRLDHVDGPLMIDISHRCVMKHGGRTQVVRDAGKHRGVVSCTLQEGAEDCLSRLRCRCVYLPFEATRERWSHYSLNDAILSIDYLFLCSMIFVDRKLFSFFYS